MPDWDHIGWWRHPAHCRSVSKVEGSILAKITARHRRQLMIEHAVVTTSSILIAAAVVFVVAFSVYCASSHSPAPEKTYLQDARPIRVERVGCPR